MEKVTKFGPNWSIYGLLLVVFVLLAFLVFGFFGFSLFNFLLFALIPGTLMAYLLSIQNTLEVGPKTISQHYIYPRHSSEVIEINNIDWIALDIRKLKGFNFYLISQPSVIIKLKNDQVFTIKLTFLKDQESIKDYFLDLSKQMADHDAELFKLKDLHGFNQLAIDATLGLTDLVEAMHQNISRLPSRPPVYQENQAKGLTSPIYKSIRAIAGLAGDGVDGLLGQISSVLTKTASSDQLSSTKQAKVSFERAALLSALNGVLGDYMVTSNNPMAIPMRFRRNGHSLKLDSDSLSETIQPMTGKLLIMVHGLCMNDLEWLRKGHDHGASLAKDLGFTPVYLRYNSGQHISTNGRGFSELLEILVRLWPTNIEDMVIIGHSMGGLVSRSALYYGEKADLKWPKKIRKVIFLGSPHHGAPLEKGGNWIDTVLGATPYTAPLAKLGKIRSSGITDLRYGSIIDEHWQGRDRFERTQDLRSPVPLPKTLQCFAIAGTVGTKTGDVRDQLLGDGLVLVNSAFGKHKDPRLTLDIPIDHQWLAYGSNHMDLLDNPDVYEKIKHWLS